MLRTKGFSAIAVIVAGVATRTNAMESHHTTEKAWQEYVRGAATRIQPVPNGLIHDWIGAVFTPNATIDGLVSVVRDYGRYKDYLPTGSHGFPVARFRNSRAGVFHGVHGHVLFVNVARRGRYRAHGVIINSHRGYSIVEVITLQQIEDYGRPGEHLLPADTGGGFIWRIYSVSQYEEWDGGVYLEIEAIVLSRGIPSSVRWLVNPVVNHLAVASMSSTLGQTGEAVDTQQVARGRLTASEHKGLN